MSMPTAQEIIGQYLYGQKIPPAPDDLRNDRFIRPKGTNGPAVTVNSEDYMRNGGGRFVGIGNFNFVRNFLQGSDYSRGAVTPGVSRLAPGVYSTGALFAAYSIPLDKQKTEVSQYFLEPTAADFKDRAYVFGSTEFRINTDARFIVKADETEGDAFDNERQSPEGLTLPLSSGWACHVGEFRLATDTFDTQFAGQIDVPEALRSLPNLGGSGNVRELHQAANACTWNFAA